VLLTALAIVALATALRFHTLGDWSFSGDEVATFQETRAFFGQGAPTGESQIVRLPRVIPAGYVILRAGYALFGWDEQGSRVVSALAGILLVGAVAVVGALPLGRRTAGLLATLVAISPAHLFQSQTNRFYSLAALFAGVAMLSAAVALKRTSGRWLSVAVAALSLAALTHTVTAALVPAIGVGMYLSRSQNARQLPPAARFLSAIVFASVAAWLGIYVGPSLAGWNEGVTWSYSPSHSVMAAINLIGWPVSMLAAVGVVLMFEDRAELRWFWFSCLAAWITTTILLPFVMPYQPWYSFPTALSVLVFAAYAAVGISERLRPLHAYSGVAFLAFVIALGLPSLASHYVDGSKPNGRAAVEYVDRHWMAGDRVATRMRVFGYYAPGRGPVLPLARGESSAETLEQLASAGGRLWVIVESGRAGLSAPVERWLSANASHRLRVTRPRFDYYENAVDVFLVSR
jgi:uncharacterized membrane protein